MGLQIRRIEAFQNFAQNKSIQKFPNKRNATSKCLSNYLALLMRKWQLGYRKNKLGVKYACGVVVSLALKLCYAAETIQCITPPKPGK